VVQFWTQVIATRYISNDHLLTRIAHRTNLQVVGGFMIFPFSLKEFDAKEIDRSTAIAHVVSTL
jgi:hypothetical protein